MSSPYDLTPSILQEYAAEYGGLPPQSAIDQFNAENAAYGLPSGNGSTAGSGLPGSNLLTAALPSTLGQGTQTLSTSQQVLSGLLAGIEHPYDTFFGSNSTYNAENQSAAGTVGAATGFLTFISDIPRLATTILGIILIIAGIFALTRGPAVNIITSAAHTAVTS